MTRGVDGVRPPIDGETKAASSIPSRQPRPPPPYGYKSIQHLSHQLEQKFKNASVIAIAEHAHGYLKEARSKESKPGEYQKIAEKISAKVFIETEARIAKRNEWPRVALRAMATALSVFGGFFSRFAQAVKKHDEHLLQEFAAIDRIGKSILTAGALESFKMAKPEIVSTGAKSSLEEHLKQRTAELSQGLPRKIEGSGLDSALGFITRDDKASWAPVLQACREPGFIAKLSPELARMMASVPCKVTPKLVDVAYDQISPGVTTIKYLEIAFPITVTTKEGSSQVASVTCRIALENGAPKIEELRFSDSAKAHPQAPKLLQALLRAEVASPTSSRSRGGEHREQAILSSDGYSGTIARTPEQLAEMQKQLAVQSEKEKELKSDSPEVHAPVIISQQYSKDNLLRSPKLKVDFPEQNVSFSRRESSKEHPVRANDALKFIHDVAGQIAQEGSSGEEVHVDGGRLPALLHNLTYISSQGTLAEVTMLVGKETGTLPHGGMGTSYSSVSSDSVFSRTATVFKMKPMESDADSSFAVASTEITIPRTIMDRADDVGISEADLQDAQMVTHYTVFATQAEAARFLESTWDSPPNVFEKQRILPPAEAAAQVMKTVTYGALHKPALDATSGQPLGYTSAFYVDVTRTSDFVLDIGASSVVRTRSSEMPDDKTKYEKTKEIVDTLRGLGGGDIFAENITTLCEQSSLLYPSLYLHGFNSLLIEPSQGPVGLRTYVQVTDDRIFTENSTVYRFYAKDAEGNDTDKPVYVATVLKRSMPREALEKDYRDMQLSDFEGSTYEVETLQFDTQDEAVAYIDSRVDNHARAKKE